MIAAMSGAVGVLVGAAAMYALMTAELRRTAKRRGRD